MFLGDVLRFDVAGLPIKSSIIMYILEMLYGVMSIFTLYFLYVVPPVITVGPSSTHEVVAGEVLSVTCAAVGEPAPRILWYHRGLILNTNVSNSTVLLTSEITAKTTTSSLKVLNVSTEDDGPYSCVAVNFLGNDSRDLAVTVVGRSGLCITMQYVSTIHIFTMQSKCAYIFIPRDN